MTPRSHDLVAWLVAIVAASGATAIAWASGARLGAGLTLGVVVMMAIILASLAIDARG